MTMYAASSIRGVSVSAAHGGCGTEHKRPEGARVWALTCPQCEPFLAREPM